MKVNIDIGRLRILSTEHVNSYTLLTFQNGSTTTDGYLRVPFKLPRLVFE